MKTIVLTIALTIALTGCSAFKVLTGNTGPITIECTKGAETFKLTLPEGSGRVFSQGIKTPETHVCGAIDTGPIGQGEDRSGGILGFIAALFIGG
jgi:hypothetical protein